MHESFTSHNINNSVRILRRETCTAAPRAAVAAREIREKISEKLMNLIHDTLHYNWIEIQ
jgi:hypothetical protein